MYPKNYENKYTTIQCTKLYCPRFGLSTFCMSTFLVGRCFDISTFWFGLVCRRVGLSTFWSVDVSVCRRFGLLRFWYVDVLVCRHFGIPVFRFVDVLVVDVSVSRRFHQLPTKGSTLTHQILFINMVIILQSTYQNGFPYPDGVAIECLWSVDGVHYFHRPECTLRCHSDLMEWYWSGIGVRRKYAN